ncbi:porin [Janthinobacterium psychrotolerans]|uniref:Porin n=1 Tax=Janthinobacterium psychrotolerans TaxID=1747903 RepID=A0A1A7C0Q9_9BURK|nr:porin [Janthinobacterium psychrotolerans]OBV38320.1 porin [Janthinobacterium psychrotolerans]
MPIMKKSPLSLRAHQGASLLFLAISGTAAQAASLPEWTLGGFGTAGLVHSSERQADYSANVINRGGAGRTDRWSGSVDSRLGAQLGVEFTPRWSAVLQVIAEHNLQNSWLPVVEWANLKYQATPELSLRLGRIALPIYLAGDYRKPGYALEWVRPPVEVYGSLPVSNSDGVDASYRWQAGATNNLTQVFYGHTSIETDDGGKRARGRQLAGLSNTTTYGALTIRASALTAELTVDLVRPLFDAFRQYGLRGGQIADRYDADHKRVAIANLGVSYDTGDWFLQAEGSRLNTRSFLGDKSSMYLGGGYRLGAWTPYATYAKVKANVPNRDAGIDSAQPGAAYLNGQLNALLQRISSQHTISTGVRWDFLPDRAVKLQYDRLRPTGASSGTLVNVQPGFRTAHPIHVVSIALDFVF